MTAYFIDLDGTLLKWGSGEPVEGAFDLLRSLEAQGHDIIITTRRGDHEWQSHPKYSIDATLEVLKKYGWDKYRILWDVPSPRVLINDEGCFALKVKKDQGFDTNLISKLLDIHYEA